MIKYCTFHERCGDYRPVTDGKRPSTKSPYVLLPTSPPRPISDCRFEVGARLNRFVHFRELLILPKETVKTICGPIWNSWQLLLVWMSLLALWKESGSQIWDQLRPSCPGASGISCECYPFTNIRSRMTSWNFPAFSDISDVHGSDGTEVFRFTLSGKKEPCFSFRFSTRRIEWSIDELFLQVHHGDLQFWPSAHDYPIFVFSVSLDRQQSTKQ